MNRILVAGLIAATLSSACGPRLRPADVVAHVGSHELTAAHLEALAKGMPTGSDPATTLPSLVKAWMDLTLAADAFAGGVNLADSAFMAEVMAPRQATETLMRLRAALDARRPGLPPGVVDSVYASDSIRALQEILIPVSDWRDARRVASSRSLADSVLALASAGRPFNALAKRYSVSIGPYGGAISVLREATVPARVRPRIWALKPGETIATQVPAGVVIMHRPVLEDVRAALSDSLLAPVNARADSSFADSVSQARHLRVATDGVVKLRGALKDSASAGDSTTLAGFDGGALSTRRALVWIGTIRDVLRSDLNAQPDSSLARALAWMAREELLAQVAREKGVDVTWQDLKAERAGLLAALAPMEKMFRGLPADMRSGKVDSLLFAMGRRESVPVLPSILMQVLRQRAPLAINADALSAVVERARLSRPPAPAPNTGAPFVQ